jgi:hypothetical protein
MAQHWPSDAIVHLHRFGFIPLFTVITVDTIASSVLC